MSEKIVNLRTALGDLSDLLNPSSTQLYPLGLEVVIQDDATGMVKTYVYVKSHAALTQYVPYVITWTGTSGGEVTTKAPGTMIAPGSKVCVSQCASFGSGYFGFVQIGGEATCMITNETVAAGDNLKVANAAVVLILNGSTTATVVDEKSVAVLVDDDYSATGNSVILLNKYAVI